MAKATQSGNIAAQGIKGTSTSKPTTSASSSKKKKDELFQKTGDTFVDTYIQSRMTGASAQGAGEAAYNATHSSGKYLDPGVSSRVTEGLANGTMYEKNGRYYYTDEAQKQYEKTAAEQYADRVKETTAQNAWANSGKSFLDRFKSAEGMTHEEFLERQRSGATAGIGAVQVWLGDLASAAGSVVNSVQDIVDKRNAVKPAATDKLNHGYTADEIAEKNRKLAEGLLNAGDALTAKGMLNIQNSKDSTTTKAGNVAVDIVTNAIQMGLDGVSQPIFGRWTTFFLRSLGSSAREARLDENIDTTNTQQIAYGAAKGLIEVGTEKMFDGLAGLFGKGLADDLVKKFVARHAKTDFGQSVLTILAGMGGEGVEEIMSDLVDPIAKKLTYDKNAELADKSEILYDGFVGAMLGAFGSGTDVIRGTSDFAGNSQAVIDYGRNSGDTKAAANAERAANMLSRRGSISNFAADRSVGGNLTEEIYAKAIVEEAAARKQEKEKTEATQKFFKGTNAEGTDFSRKVDTFAKTNFEGKDRDITMTRVDGQNMVKLTAADNSSVAMTLDEAEANNAIPEDVHDFMVQLDAKLGEYAEAAYNAYDGSMSTGDYIRALDYGASVLAANNISLDTAGKDTDVGKLTPTQKKLAVSIGQNMAKNRVVVRGKAGNGTMTFGQSDKLQEGMNPTSEEEARKVWGDNADGTLAIIQALAEKTKLDFVAFDSKIGEYKDEEGNTHVKLGSKQGMYSTEGTIFYDIRAGQDKNGLGEALVSYTLSHELTHFEEHNAGKSYDDLKSFVLDHLSELREGHTLQDLVDDVMARSSKPMSYDEAVSEVVADTCETMLPNSKYIRQIAQEKPTLARTIKEWIDSFLEKLRATLKGRHEGAKYFESSVELLQKLSALWDQALQDAIANTSAAEQIGIEINAKTESAAPGDVTQLSERSWTESDYVQKKEEAAQELAKSLNISVQRAMEYIDSVNSVAKTIANDRMRLDYQASEGVSSLVGNTEYGGSIDFSTICKKRRLLTGTFTAIQNALPNTALTADEILTIRKMMKDKGYEVSCGLCYVEGSRAKMGEYAKQFLDEYAKTNPDYLPNMSEINTPEGIEKIRTQHPDVYEAYETFMNSLAQRKPKLYQLATEYKNEIYQKFKNNRKQVEKYNYNGGLRLQSFSDFEIIHLIDNMQVIMDMANVGLAGQAYTKVPEFAWAMGKTGLKINLSLIAKGVENGKLVLDEVEGMKRADAQALRNAYSDNVGTILVVFNDEQLKAAMADDFIDYIIPFHRSQWNSKQYELMGLPANAKDFTMWQNESYIEPVYNKNGKKTRPSNYMPNGYWDFSKTGTENAEAYLRMCAQNNRTPKFSFLLDQNEDGSYSLKKDGSTDGYWKLLIDFKMYNNDGIGVPQQPAQPIFNEGPESDPHTTLGMLKAYEGGHQSFPVAQDIVDKFVNDYKASHKDVEQFSLRGVRDDGIEVYETSDETLSLSWKERKQRFINYLSNDYRGRTAKFMRNGHPYYARFDYVDANKNVYGDTKSDRSGRDAKINTGADGDIFTLSENMSYRNSTPETGKKSPAHRDVRYWDYYVKTVQIDGKVFDITANIRVKPEGEYVYYLQLVENKNIKAASPRIDPKSLGDLNGVPTAYETSVSQTSDESNDYLQEFGTSSQYSERETDPYTLQFLNDQENRGEVVHTYKSFLEIDGKLYPPMASKTKGEDGKYRMANAMEVGAWEKSVGNPKNLIIDPKTGKGYFQLKKDQGTPIKAAYNPYQHSSNLMLNDQFEAAYTRPNLVTYECIIPKSELTSGYQAEYAKDPVGKMSWHSGVVASKLTNETRDVYLSRWLKPIRRVSDAEVAAEYKRLLTPDNISVPFNVVTPGLLAELEKAGVPIDYNGSPQYQSQVRRSQAKQEQNSERDDNHVEEAAAKHFGTTENYHEAGYILSDGRMLDFSGRHWGLPDNQARGRRDVDHEDIFEVYEELGEFSGGDTRWNFIRNGNIRFSPEAPGINLSQYNEPTAAQYDRIRDFLREEKPDSFYVDLEASSSKRSDTDRWLRYSNNVNADKVVNDIKYWFKNKKVPEQSTTSMFHEQWSERDDYTPEDKVYVDQAVDYFGTTKNFDDAAYLLKDGRMLNFNNKNDRLDLGEYWEEKAPYGDNLDHDDINLSQDMEMDEFMRIGNIRIISEFRKYAAGIEFGNNSDAPTKQQYDVIRKFAEHAFKQGREFIVGYREFVLGGPGGGEEVFSPDTPVDTVINNIRYYFANGETRSNIAQFHSQYSERDNAKSDRELLVDALDTVAQNDEEISQLENYRKNVKRLNELDKKLTSEQKILRKLVAGGGSDAEIAEQRQKVRDMQQKLTAQDQKLLDLQATTPLKNVLTRERKRVSDETRRMVRERMQDREDVVKYRAQVEKKTKRLYRLLSEETIQRHVPNTLQQPLAEFLDSINFDSRRRLSGGESTKKDLKMDQIATELGRILSNQQKYISGDENVEGFGGYIDISEESLQTLEEMGQKVRDAARTTGGEYTVNQMTAAELKDLSKLLSNIYTGINNINNFMANERYASVKAAADEDMAYLTSLRETRENTDSKFYTFVEWKNALPHFALQRYGNGAAAIQDGYERAWEKFAFNIKEIEDFTGSLYTSEEVDAWESDVREVELEDGSKIRISIAQIMELAEYMKQQQSVQHAEKGGVRIGTISTVTGEKPINDVKHYHLSGNDLENILGMLSDRQLEVANKLQSFMAKYGSVKGNEVSRRRFGYDAFTEGENYFPIVTDDNTRPMKDTDDQSSDLFRLLNLGSTKKRNPKANNALLINSIFDTFSDHTADMAKYNALALPVLDAIKYYNYNVKDKAEDGSFSVRSMQGAMEQAFGKNAQSYYRTLIKDINGVHEGGDRASNLFNLSSNYKVSAVGANLRVALLQPTSYVRASFVIEPKYLAAAFGMKNGYKEAMKYSGTAVWKSLGFYDTNIARGLREQIKGKRTFKDTLVEKSMKGAEIGDQRTWGRLWNACKLKTQAETGLSGEELNVKTADLFREVIYSSQVMDSTLTRSEIMRSNKGYDKMLTAFMSEPTLSYNILLNAFDKYKLDVRENGKDGALTRNAESLKKAFNVYASSVVFAAIVESFVDALRDNDDEEFWKKYLQAMLGEGDNFAMKFLDSNLGSDLSIIGKLPILKNIPSILRGYGVSGDMATEGLQSMYEAIVAWTKKGSSLNTWGKTYKTMQAVSQIIGIPVSGFARDVQAVWNNSVAVVFPNLKIRNYKLLTGSKEEKWEEFAKPVGISQADYKRILSEADAIGDGNGHLKKDELGAYLESSTLTNEEKYAMWATQGWKATYDEWLADN